MALPTEYVASRGREFNTWLADQKRVRGYTERECAEDLFMSQPSVSRARHGGKIPAHFAIMIQWHTNGRVPCHTLNVGTKARSWMLRNAHRLERDYTPPGGAKPPPKPKRYGIKGDHERLRRLGKTP